MKAISTLRSMRCKISRFSIANCPMSTTASRWNGGRIPGRFVEQFADTARAAYAPFEMLDNSQFHVDFFSCDYLGFGLNRDLNQAHADAILRYGMNHNVSSVVSQPFNSPVRDSERALARWLKSEDAVLTSSCTAANFGVMEILLRENERPVYLDHKAHSTLQLGVFFAGASSRARQFRHNNLDHLRSLIAKNGSGVVAVDSIYSSYGGEAPLSELVDLCRDLHCILVVDESHATGVVGERGEGLVAHLGLEDGVHVRTTSLNKGFSCSNGLVASNKEVTDCYNHGTTLAIGSRTVQAPDAIKAKKAMELTIQANEKRENLRNLSRLFRQQLKEAGYPVIRDDIDHPVVALLVGDTETAVRAHNKLCSKKIYPWVFGYPATTRNEAIVRFVLNQSVTQDKLAYTINVMNDLRDDLKPWTWAGEIKPMKNYAVSSNHA